MCPFEILHFAPLALIAASLFASRSSDNKMLINFSIVILSIVGLVAGEHMHHAPEHMEPFTTFDPCLGYVISLFVSGFSFSKSAVVKLVERNKA